MDGYILIEHVEVIVSDVVRTTNRDVLVEDVLLRLRIVTVGVLVLDAPVAE